MARTALALTSMVAFACGGGDDGPETVSTMITAATGGDVNIGSATLSIPANALGADTTITVTSDSPADDLPDQATLTGRTYDFGPDGLTFTTPAMLTLPVSGTPGTDEEAVISWLDTSDNTWKDLATTISGGEATAPITHFTIFIVRFRGMNVSCSTTVCGGDVVGTWNIAGVCANFTSTGFEEFCPTATVDIVIDGSGTVTFNGDLSYAVNINMTGTMDITLPAECTSNGLSACADISSSLTCTGTPATGCDCTQPINNQLTEQGTYALAGSGTSSTVTFTETGGTPSAANGYCVSGTQLTVISNESNGQVVYTANLAAAP